MAQDEFPLTMPPLPSQELPSLSSLAQEPESYTRQDEPTQEQLEQALLHFVIKVVPPPPKPLIDQLNPQSPADKAMALSLKMVKLRQERQAKQTKILSDLRNSRIHAPLQVLEPDISQIVEKQNYMKGHRYLREAHYNTLTPRPKRVSQSVVLPKLSLAQQRQTIRREGLLLQKYKRINLHHEAKKIVQDLLYLIIGKSVETYHRKHDYFKAKTSKKISQMLGQSLVRKSRVRKGSLTLSRVVDISIRKVEEEESDENQEQEKSESSVEDKKSQTKDEKDSSSLSDEEESSLDDQKDSEEKPLYEAKLNSSDSNDESQSDSSH